MMIPATFRILMAVVCLSWQAGSFAQSDSRPNVLWFVVDDMSASFSCYGETIIRTPHLDRLATEGTRFAHAFTTAPVCSPCRSALITGVYQTSIGAHHHRSGRGVEKIHLPADVVPVPELFHKAGYYTCIGGPLAKGNRPGKTDYNFEWDPAIYDGNDWSGRKPGQPFFMQVQLHGGKSREGQGFAKRVAEELGTATRPEDVTLPPYYPRDPVLLNDWARYLDSVRLTDREIGEVLTRLEQEQILDNTLIIFMTDHGISHARGKQFLYDEGTHIPFVVRGPGIPRGVVRSDLIEHIDMAAISLAACGIRIPPTMQGRNVFASDYQPRDAVFAARDRCDETVEHLRSVRTDRWLYIRNFLPQRPHLQPNGYKDGKLIVQRLRELHAQSQLDELAERLLFASSRPSEELYEWKTDKWQVRNLASNPGHADTLAELRRRLDQWMQSTNDAGREPEPAAMYDSDMAVYLSGGKKADSRIRILESNIRQMKQWASEGK